MQEPKYDLEKVKKICERYLEGAEPFVNFIAPSRSLKCIVEVTGCKPSEAGAICIQGILQLKPNDFSHRTMQWETVADVYGLANYQASDWYVKFTLYGDGEQMKLEEISFHPPKKDLKLVDGRVLPSTEGDES